MRVIDIKRDFKRNWTVYLMALPVFAYYIIWHYVPMGGLLLAFEQYSPRGGVFLSEWVGVKNFVDFFKSYYFWRLLRNTLVISLTTLAVNFPAPIILALLLNEVENKLFKKVVQTISYMPHFISVVVICGILTDFLAYNGVITDILVKLGVSERKNILTISSAFRPVYVLSGTWQQIGYNSIIYLAALSGVDQELYEAARIDGAGRWKQTLHITLPSIAPTITIMLILRLGAILGVGMEKVLLLYMPSTYDKADVIQTFVYRRGLLEGDYGYSTAVGMFNSVVNLIILCSANAVARKYSETSLF